MSDYWDDVPESEDEKYIRLNKTRVFREIRELPMSRLTVGDYEIVLNAMRPAYRYASLSARDLRNLEELLQKVYNRYGR